MPIYEPGLGELVARNQRAGRLLFATDLGEGILGRELVFITVGTPPDSNGRPDLSVFWQVVDAIRDRAESPLTVVIKSTVPVGTAAAVDERLNQGQLKHHTASNPEFLNEGRAVENFTKPDRVVVGARDREAVDMLAELYSPFLRSGHPMLVMSPESAEMTQYATNCFLAAKTSYINEIANLCERTGADINEVIHGIGQDSRIGFPFLNAGVGYGGSSFAEDVSAMVTMADEAGVPAQIIRAVDGVNNTQRTLIMEKLLCLLDGSVRDKTIGVWGLAFKPQTDDIRDSAAVALIRQLIEGGAKVRAYDPAAMGNARAMFNDSIKLCDQAFTAAEGADALAVVTQWQEFRKPDFDILRKLMNRPIIVDGRNLYDPKRVSHFGFTYSSIGRPTSTPAPAAVTGSVETTGMEVGI